MFWMVQTKAVYRLLRYFSDGGFLTGCPFSVLCLEYAGRACLAEGVQPALRDSCIDTGSESAPDAVTKCVPIGVVSCCCCAIRCCCVSRGGAGGGARGVVVVYTFPRLSYVPLVKLPSLLFRKMLPFWIVPVVIPFVSVRTTLPSIMVPKIVSPLLALTNTLPSRILPVAEFPLLSW